MPRTGIGRIRSRRAFTALRQSGKRGRSGPVTVTFLRQTSSSEPQVAFAISRRVGGAVTRNQLRRRLRAILVDMREQLLDGAYLVNTGPGAAGLTFDELRKAMTQAVQVATGAQVTGATTGETMERQ